MTAMTVLAIVKGIKAKAMPVIKAYACKSCYTLATVSLKGNRITVQKCACQKGAK